MRFDKRREGEALDQLLARPADHLVFPGEARADGNILVGREHLRVFMRRYFYRLLVDAELSRGEFLIPDCGVYDCQSPFHCLRSPIAGHISDHCRNGHKYTVKDFQKNGNHFCRQCLALRKERRRHPPGPAKSNVCTRGHDLDMVGVYTSTDRAGRIHRTCKKCKLQRLREQRKTR
jgi:hypothetical protein